MFVLVFTSVFIYMYRDSRVAVEVRGLRIEYYSRELEWPTNCAVTSTVAWPSCAKTAVCSPFVQ